MVRHDARQFTIRERWFGPLLYVRKAEPTDMRGTFDWGPWRKAKPGEIQMAIIKLAELQRV